jgi:hypothetical protein
MLQSHGGLSQVSLQVLEGTRAVTRTQASDADLGTVLAYSLAGGADAALFVVDATTGSVSFRGAPSLTQPQDADANHSYLVAVAASDGLNTAVQTYAVGVVAPAPVPLEVAVPAPIAAPPANAPAPSPAASPVELVSAPAPSPALPAAPAPVEPPAPVVVQPPAEAVNPATGESSAQSSASTPNPTAPAATRERSAAAGSAVLAPVTESITTGGRAQAATGRDGVFSDIALAMASNITFTVQLGPAGVAVGPQVVVTLADFVAQSVDAGVASFSSASYGLQAQSFQAGSRSGTQWAAAESNTRALAQAPVEQALDLQTNAVRYTGVAVSAGVVWWATRAGGLFASLLMGTPAWRQLDLVPVLRQAELRGGNAQGEGGADGEKPETAEERLAQDLFEK